MSLEKSSGSSMEKAERKLQNTLVVAIDPLNLLVYPNPVSGTLHALFNSATEGEAFRLYLVNVYGHIIIGRQGITKRGSNLIDINTAAFGKGFYIVDLFIGIVGVQ